MGFNDDVRKVTRKLEANFDDSREAARTAIYWIGARIMRKAVTLTPVDTGRLRATAYVALPTMHPMIMCRIGFGTNYAVYVHEIMVNHRAPTRDHYLSIPLREARPSFQSDLAKYIKKALATTSFIGGGAFPAAPVDTGATLQAARRAASRRAAARKHKALERKRRKSGLK